MAQTSLRPLIGVLSHTVLVIESTAIIATVTVNPTTEGSTLIQVWGLYCEFGYGIVEVYHLLWAKFTLFFALIDASETISDSRSAFSHLYTL